MPNKPYTPAETKARPEKYIHGGSFNADSPRNWKRPEAVYSNFQHHDVIARLLETPIPDLAGKVRPIPVRKTFLIIKTSNNGTH
jgi:hypothetical protein